MKNFLTLFVQVLLITIALYGLVYLFPINNDSELDKQTYKKIESIDTLIDKLEKNQEKYNEGVKGLNVKIDSIDTIISNVKNQKIIIKQEYHEKIKVIDNYTDAELDSFFTKRYGPY